MPNDVTLSRQAEELATAFLSRVWNGSANDLSAIDELMTEDYQIHSAMKTISGPDSGSATFNPCSRMRAMKSSRSSPMRQATASSRGGCAQVSTTKYSGFPPMGDPSSFWRVENGRLAECWIERAALEAYRDLASACRSLFVPIGRRLPSQRPAVAPGQALRAVAATASSTCRLTPSRAWIDRPWITAA